MIGVKKLVFAFIATSLSIIALLFHLYRPVVSGTIYLDNAPGEVHISYEDKTGIAHISGDDLKSVVYAQGY